MTATSTTAHPGLLGRAQTTLGPSIRLVERGLVAASAVSAGVLLVTVAVLLLAGAVSRFAFNAPIVWVDELVSTLFLWLAMLGAVVAYHRAEHMRMAAVAMALRGRLQEFVDALSLAATVALLAFLLPPACEYALDEWDITTSTLALSGAWRAAALPVGLGSMLILGVLHCVRFRNVAVLTLAALFCVAVTLMLHWLSPELIALGNYRLLIFFVALTGTCIAVGLPIAFCFLISTFLFLACTTTVPLTVVTSRLNEGMSHVVLLAVPLFIWLGSLVEVTGMAKAMVNFLATLVGHWRGGLNYVLMAAMYLVSGISGAKAADMAAVAPPLFPEMRRRGADSGDLVALLAATGAQTETIPPSIVLITIGSVTGVSIAGLFAGGILPSLVMGLFLAAVVWWRSRRAGTASSGARASWSDSARCLLVAVPALLLPFVIRTAVVEGAATATEVSTLGVFYAIVYLLLARVAFGRPVDRRAIVTGIVNTVSLSGAILLIVGAASAMAWSLTQSGFARQLTMLMHHAPGGAYGFLLVSILIFVILGSVLEGLPAIVLMAPITYPIARSFAINDIHYSIVVVLAMGIGLFVPPFGVGYYTACAIGKVDTGAALRPIIGYMVALVAGLMLIAFVPAITTSLLP
ncbi:TRAP transporter large permease subunit [Azospirillum sp. TSA6c]|uniref:TRAP transporter large permease n=1 Tax=unclassified Azospirillum TaxID=2630922 RepID=UPI000D61666D|nr:TRAP transporter large permease subunit [Azospirillum sp. TSA6c]PWC47048.1 ABC transporter permease [Azospirillum sp. TSA6c]PWC53314.1 ABC transporter permease [Azospirillum sp. TSA6c]